MTAPVASPSGIGLPPAFQVKATLYRAKSASIPGDSVNFRENSLFGELIENSLDVPPFFWPISVHSGPSRGLTDSSLRFAFRRSLTDATGPLPATDVGSWVLSGTLANACEQQLARITATVKFA